MCGRLVVVCLLLLVAAPSSFLVAQQSSSQNGAYMSDRDKAGLRGPVRIVISEQTFSLADGKQVVTTNISEYARDGRKLEERWVNSNGPEWVTKYSYHSDGRLSKIQSGNAGSAPDSETKYLYDDARKLVGMQSGDKVQARYHYDEAGQKSLTVTFEAMRLAPNTAYASHWEGTDLGFAEYLGGTLTTFYNEHDVATGAEFRDLEGKLVGHIVRKFDRDGRVTEEEQFADAAPEFPFPEEIRSKFNPEQIKRWLRSRAACKTESTLTHIMRKAA